MGSVTELVTSALPYVNAYPHLGTLCPILGGDIYARYLRKLGKDVIYLCGTDEAGTTTEIKALKEGLSCREICDKYNKIHKEVYDWFNISFDIFGRTLTSKHSTIVQDIFLKLHQNGHTLEKTVTEFKCNNCNKYLSDRFLRGVCYFDGCESICNGDQCDKCKNLIDASKLQHLKCSLCGSEPEKIISKQLYLNLISFVPNVEKTMLSGLETIMTTNAYSITKSWIEKELEPRSITRSLDWGISIPQTDKYPELENYKNKVFYVWFDAPIGYISILYEGLENKLKGKKIDINKIKLTQFLGIDNTFFHSIMFPSMLWGSDYEFPVVSNLVVTDYLQYNGNKFSKSEGKGVFGDHVKIISDKLGITEDYWRYYLAKIRPETASSSFTWDDFCSVTRADLNQRIGNLVSRTLGMVKKLYGVSHSMKYDFSLCNEQADILLNINMYKENITNFKYRDAVKNINKIADIGNLYVSTYELWKKKDKNDETNILFSNLLFIIYILAELIDPIMPNKSGEIKSYINTKNSVLIDFNTSDYIIYDTINYKNLFKVIELEDIKSLLVEMNIKD